MARISGVDLPRDKRVEIGLTYIHGIGRRTSQRILAQAGVDPNTRVRDLTEGAQSWGSLQPRYIQVAQGSLRYQLCHLQ